MIVVPLAAVPSQILTITLGEKNCQIMVYTLGVDNRLYADVLIDGAPIITAVLCQDRVRIVQLAYLAFPGDLAFVDTQGVTDPIYSGLGSRYLLVYLP